jgi:acyl-CoA synthetase (AMP-forming)/AMP-acid ligase II
MGLRRVLHCIRVAEPAAILSVRRLLQLWPVLSPLWGLKRFSLDGAGLGYESLESLVGHGATELEVLRISSEDPAFMTFTSGTSGKPKGAVRHHGLLKAQHEALREELPEHIDDVELVTLPMFALHNLLCGITSVIAPVDLRSPGSAKGEIVAEEIRRRGVTRIGGAPAFFERLFEHVEASGEVLDQVRFAYVGGAPVTRRLCERMRSAFPRATCLLVYGSTEAEPMTSIDISEVLDSEGEGHLVGRPCSAANIEVVGIPHGLHELDTKGIEPYRRGKGELGEVVVSGPHVNPGYFRNTAADRELKLREPGGAFWHRTGDVGRVDDQGRLWLLGRTADMLHIGEQELHPFPIEDRLGRCKGVSRAAIVNLQRGKRQGVAVAIALTASARLRDAEVDIINILRRAGLKSVEIYYVSEIPTDNRHNSKVDRVRLCKVMTKKSSRRVVIP